MSQLGLPFYGLTLTPEDKLRIADEIFNLYYYSNGGITHDEAYSMPVYRRIFNLNRIVQEKRKESEAAKSQEQDMTSKPKGVARPAVRKPA